MVSIPFLQKIPHKPLCATLPQPWSLPPSDPIAMFCSWRSHSTLLGFFDEDLVQEDENLEAKNSPNDNFIAGFCIHAGNLEHWKFPWQTYFCSNIGKWEYYNTFITGFQIFCPGLTEPNINVNVNAWGSERVRKGMPQLLKRARYLTVKIYKEAF